MATSRRVLHPFAESWAKAISFSNWLTVIVKWIMAISMPVDAGNLAEAYTNRREQHSTAEKHDKSILFLGAF